MAPDPFAFVGETWGNVNLSEQGEGIEEEEEVVSEVEVHLDVDFMARSSCRESHGQSLVDARAIAMGPLLAGTVESCVT